jgi:hypothetical protein
MVWPYYGRRQQRTDLNILRLTGEKKPPGKLDFAGGLDPPIFFREEKNEQVPVAIIHAAAP